MFKHFLKIFLLFTFVSCTSSPEFSRNKPEDLARALHALDAHIPQEESAGLADEIFRQTVQLRQKFDPVSEPHFNNFLINMGVKKQGLCYEWSDALYTYFEKNQYPHFEFHLLVADRGKYFLEHNVLVVTAKQGDVMDGIIIDPWRKPGTVYFSKVKEDTRYTWQHRSQRCCQNGR